MLENYFSLIKDALPKKFGAKSKYLALVKTFGCQQNFADSERICGILKECGFDFTEDENEADLIVFNTCAIRKHAEDRFFAFLGNTKKLKEKNKNLVVVVCGCMSQKAEIFNIIKTTFPFVNLVLGTDYFKVFPKFLYKSFKSKNMIYFNKIKNDINAEESLPVKRTDKIKASVPIVYGCNNFCSYCIVPYVRGRERSRDLFKILDEVEGLVEKGYKEILLLGQNVNSYGKDLKNNVNFSELLKRMDEIEGDFWVRFMTSNPKDITKELIDTMANSKHITPYMHLPVQSGNNRILKIMNRKYTKEQYEEIVEYAKSKIPGLCLSTDIIVGFPGETEKEFLDTVDLVKKVKFFLIYSFIFSKREGTLAAKMDDPVPYKEKAKRLGYLLNVQKGITDNLFASFVGTTQRVLVEKSTKNQKVFLARTPGNILTKVHSEKKEILGKFLKVKIISSTRTYLEGEEVQK